MTYDLPLVGCHWIVAMQFLLELERCHVNQGNLQDEVGIEQRT